MKQIVIDGIEYVPLGTVVSAECMKALSKAYTIAFGWGIYDPCCEDGRKQFKEIWDHLNQANKELQFTK
jgi:hypothetical protein